MTLVPERPSLTARFRAWLWLRCWAYCVHAVYPDANPARFRLLDGHKHIALDKHKHIALDKPTYDALVQTLGVQASMLPEWNETL